MNTTLKAFLCTLALCLLMTMTLNAQRYDVEWYQTYGGLYDDQGFCVRQTNDGGFIITGYTNSPPHGPQILLLKTDSEGDSIWGKTFGDTVGTFASSGYDVQQTTDGGYIIAGCTYYDTVGLLDCWLIKTDSLGTKERDLKYGGPDYDEFKSVLQTVDGGYIVTGYTSAIQKDLLVIKTDDSLNIVWDSTYYGGGDEAGNCIIPTLDGDFIIAGATSTFGHPGTFDVWLVKMDTSGNIIWTNSFGGPGQHDFGACVRQTLDGGYIIAANAASFGDSLAYDGWLIKTDAEGDCTWSRLYGDIGVEDFFNSVMVSESGYVIVGSTQSTVNDSSDLWIVVTDTLGYAMWDTTLDGSSWNDVAYSIDSVGAGECVITGYKGISSTDNDVWLIYLSPVIQPIEITLSPFNPPIVVPVTGGSFNYTVTLINTTQTVLSTDFWVNITLPNSFQFRALGPLNLSLPGGSNVTRLRTQIVPPIAPPGAYFYWGIIGTYPWNIATRDGFPFVKAGADNPWQGPEGWLCSGESFPDEDASAPQPSGFSLDLASPNPFNSSTTISYQLPANSFVNLSVYDISGKLVETLAEGLQEAGKHQVTFDGSGLAAGVYLCRLTAGEFTAVQKLVLLK